MSTGTAGGGASVFISYRRRTSWSLARLVSTELTRRGADVFMDVEGERSGVFQRNLLSEIEKRDNVVVLVEQETFTGDSAENDWVVREVAHALAHRKNVIPVTAENLDLDRAAVPAPIRKVTTYNAVSLSHHYFDAAMDRLRGQLVASGETCPDEGSSELPISVFPGLSIAGVPISSTEEVIKSILGEPTTIVGDSFGYPDDGLFVSMAHGRVMFISALAANGRVTAFRGRTPEGISIGSTRDEVRAAYGSPPLLQKRYLKADVDRYLRLGIEFTYDPRSSTVVKMTVQEAKRIGFMEAAR